MRKLLVTPILAFGVLAAAVAPSGARTSSTERPTIAQIVAKSGGTFDSNHYDYDILLTSVKAAGLVDALNNPSSKLTVFAPNDRAFIRTARDFGYTGWDEAGAFNAIAGVLGTLDPKGKGDPIPALTNVLLYHVASGSLGPIQVLLSGSIHTLLPGASFDVRFLRLVDKAPKRPDPYLNPYALNIKASNGVIHGITRVLLPVNA
jgi:serralysin